MLLAIALCLVALAVTATPAPAAVDQIRVTGDRSGQQPTVDDFAVQLQLVDGRRLTRVWLEIHDNTMPGADPAVDLLPEARVVRGTSGRVSVHLPLPLWDVGPNLVTVHATTAGPSGYRTLRTREVFTWYPPRGWGISEGGRRFAPPGVPPRATGCPFVFCKDADRDGLLDLWENVAARQLRPVLVLDESEDLLEHDNHYIRTFARVTPVDGGRNILFRVANAFSRDYGDPGAGLGSHNGDVPTPQMLWRLSGDAIRLEWLRANHHLGGWDWWTYTVPFHQDWVQPVERLRFDGAGTLKLWVEEDKHGLWWSNEACEEDGPYDCNGGPVVSPYVVNAGEPTDRFLDELDRLSWDGPFGRHAGLFPGERVWSARTDGHGFCGGLGTGDGCSDQSIGDALKILRTQHPRHGDDDPTLITPGSSP
jgi:hypothetical protein